MKLISYTATGCFFLALAACKKTGEIKVYTVDRQPAASHHLDDPHGSPHGTALPQVSMPGDGDEPDPHAGMTTLPTVSVSDEAPDHWREKKRTAMRMASYQVDGLDGAVADVSFTRLQSVPGSLLMNLNRWRSQLGHAPWTEEQMREATSSTPTFFGDGVLIDVEGLIEKGEPKTDGRIIGVVAEKDGSAWYYKMRGNAELAASEKQNFIKWVNGLSLNENPEQLPPVITRRDVTWSLPKGWVSSPGAQSRYANIEVPGADGATTEIAVSFFPGDVGGDAANVNRWRGQVGLPAVSDALAVASIQKISAGDKEFNLVDLKGAQRRMLAAWSMHGEQTWFFKWTGEDAVLESAKGEFANFLQSVRFHTPES